MATHPVWGAQAFARAHLERLRADPIVIQALKEAGGMGANEERHADDMSEATWSICQRIAESTEQTKRVADALEAIVEMLKKHEAVLFEPQITMEPR